MIPTTVIMILELFLLTTIGDTAAVTVMNKISRIKMDMTLLEFVKVDLVLST